ncbi:hypothetical protein M0P48_03710 [Candidatus Gracilibacteria bacterium]|jgi:hypothetical protein|nr:hypothetical protein [Candidatus Gracilibacteria bacterium]
MATADIQPGPIEDLELTIGGNIVRIKDIGEALAGLSPDEFLLVLRRIIEKGGGDGLKLLVDGLEIQMTPSAFADPEKTEKLESTAQEYPFSRWLKEMEVLPSQATRESLCSWWDAFMLMAGENGYRPGNIDYPAKMNLWKATGPLARKMLDDTVRYRFLPALLANHPQEVARVLGELKDPEAFLELLTGECMEDMRRSPKFLGAFSTTRKKENIDEGTDEISREVRDAIFSVMLILQRTGK